MVTEAGFADAVAATWPARFDDATWTLRIISGLISRGSVCRRDGLLSADQASDEHADDQEEDREGEEHGQRDHVPEIDGHVLEAVRLVAQLTDHQRPVREVVVRSGQFELEKMGQRADQTHGTDHETDDGRLEKYATTTVDHGTGSRRGDPALMTRVRGVSSSRHQRFLECHHQQDPEAGVPEPLVDAPYVSVEVLVSIAVFR